MKIKRALWNTFLIVAVLFLVSRYVTVKEGFRFGFKSKSKSNSKCSDDKEVDQNDPNKACKLKTGKKCVTDNQCNSDSQCTPLTQGKKTTFTCQPITIPGDILAML